MLETGLRVGYTATLHTPFMNTTAKCLRLFYRLSGPANSSLTLMAVDEDNEVHIMRVVYGSDMEMWAGVYTRMPAGLHWLAIIGQRGQTGSSGIRVDDIEVVDCSQLTGDNLCHNSNGAR